MGAATVSATTLALAPGYWQVTCTVGGVISGYWAIGRENTAARPARAMTIEMTQAKTGRSMKKRANTGCLLSGFRLGAGGNRGLRVVRSRGGAAAGPRGYRHVHQFRFDDGPGSHPLQAVDDDPLAGLQPVLDGAQPVVDRPQFHGAVDDLVLVTHQVDDLLPLVGLDGSVG